MSFVISSLRRYKDNRGVMANLKCSLIPAKKHLSLPILSKLGIDILKDINITIAGLYATHPFETDKGNFGHTCKIIQQRREEKSNEDTKLTPVEKRFQQMLSASTLRELIQRIIKFVILAKNHDVPINYMELEKDLNQWSDRTKTNWSLDFWAYNNQNNSEE